MSRQFTDSWLTVSTLTMMPISTSAIESHFPKTDHDCAFHSHPSCRRQAARRGTAARPAGDQRVRRRHRRAGRGGLGDRRARIRPGPSRPGSRRAGAPELDLLSTVRVLDPLLPVVVMAEGGSINLAVEAMRRGARDFVQKPLDSQRVLDNNTNAGRARPVPAAGTAARDGEPGASDCPLPPSRGSVTVNAIAGRADRPSRSVGPECADHRRAGCGKGNGRSRHSCRFSGAPRRALVPSTSDPSSTRCLPPSSMASSMGPFLTRAKIESDDSSWRTAAAVPRRDREHSSAAAGKAPPRAPNRGGCSRRSGRTRQVNVRVISGTSVRLEDEALPTTSESISSRR